MTGDLARALGAIVGSTNVVSDPNQLARLSRDYSWFSPVLDLPMRQYVADVAVAPGRTSELVRVLELAADLGQPITVRGGGTGNYGQAVPMHGGILVTSNRLNAVLESTDETVTMQPGARLGDVTRELARYGRDLRILPSTWLTSSVAGFVAGGTGGIGSIMWGTLRDGNVSSLVVHSVARPSAPEHIAGDDLLSIIHTYGTAGVIGDVTMPVQPLLPWEEAVYSFPDLESAQAFAMDAVELDLPKRLLSVHEWPIPSYFGVLEKVGAIHHGRVTVLVEAVQAHGPAFIAASRAHRGMLTWAAPTDAYHRSPIGVSNFAFNHTTLVGKLADPSLTYLQIGFGIDNLQDGIRFVRENYPHEIAFHVEFMRVGERLVAAALPLFPFHGEDALNDLMALFTEAGANVINPHTHLLDPARAHPGLLPAKRRNDPEGLLNPGKLATIPAR